MHRMRHGGPYTRLRWRSALIGSGTIMDICNMEAIILLLLMVIQR